MYGLTPEDFVRVLGNLVTLADEWKERLAAIFADAAATAHRNAAELAALQGEADETLAVDGSTLLRV